MTTYQFVCPCLFGLESVLSGELRRMGADNVKAYNGKVTFTGDANMMARANIGLRTAERVLIEIGTFRAQTFSELFDHVRALPIEEYIGSRDAFPVKGWALESKLMSVPDCQAIIKKAMVERLRHHYKMDWFPETGALHQIQFSIYHDEVSVMLDTSGAGLHKRGYRVNANAAPIKETLAAGMLDLIRVYPDTVLCDPFCGSGTILIEAAMKALNVPPGLKRKFAAQNFGMFDESVWRQERQRGIDQVRRDITFFAYGSDIDPESVALAKENAKKAGVFSRMLIGQKDIRSLVLREDITLIAANPPYGERMLEQEEARELYRVMGKAFSSSDAAKAIITPDEQFETLYGKKADKRRKLYNGMLKCQLYLYQRNRKQQERIETYEAE